MKISSAKLPPFKTREDVRPKAHNSLLIPRWFSGIRSRLVKFKKEQMNKIKNKNIYITGGIPKWYQDNSSR